MIHAKYLLFFWDSRILVYVTQKVDTLVSWIPKKTLGMESLMSFPEWQHSTCVHCKVKEVHPMWLHWESTLGELHPVSFRLPHAPFPFANFALCPFMIIIQSHDNYILSPMSLPSKSANLRMVLKIPKIASYWLITKFTPFACCAQKCISPFNIFPTIIKKCWGHCRRKGSCFQVPVWHRAFPASGSWGRQQHPLTGSIPQDSLYWVLL